MAIVLMVMLSTMVVSKNFEGMEMVYSIGKLLFFIIMVFDRDLYHTYFFSSHPFIDGR